jgi:hypothetical protein
MSWAAIILLGFLLWCFIFMSMQRDPKNEMAPGDNLASSLIQTLICVLAAIGLQLLLDRIFA